MQSGFFLFGALVLAVVFVVVATTRYKVHPFLALIAASYGMGLAGGLAPGEIVGALTGGFGGTAGYIGIVITCGCIIGVALERSGCALVMAETMLRLVGRRRSVLAMSTTGALVSIPVFCDSGYVVLSPLIHSLARRTGTSLAAFAVALSMGLYATHCLVPPTPGPLATAGTLEADIGAVIMFGLIVAIPVVAATCAYAQFAGRRIRLDPVHSGEEEARNEPGEAAPAPAHGWPAAFAPIVFPVLLIALGSVANLPGRPFGEGIARDVLGMAGNPNTALLLGVVLGGIVLRRRGMEAFGSWSSDGLRDAGTIILITGAGGALGGVLRETPMGTIIGDQLTSLGLGRFSIVLPFIVAAGLKTAIGSSTAAMITTASLVSPLLPAMGLAPGFGPVLTTLAISCGSMMVSHVNDSFFWVITQMSGMTVGQGYRLVTAGSAIAGVAGMAAVITLALLLI
ncbi:MAG: GntP family permease [Opitutaceae bacterium]